MDSSKLDVVVVDLGTLETLDGFPQHLAVQISGLDHSVQRPAGWTRRLVKMTITPAEIERGDVSSGKDPLILWGTRYCERKLGLDHGTGIAIPRTVTVIAAPTRAYRRTRFLPRSSLRHRRERWSQILATKFGQNLGLSEGGYPPTELKSRQNLAKPVRLLTCPDSSRWPDFRHDLAEIWTARCCGNPSTIGKLALPGKPKLC